MSFINERQLETMPHHIHFAMFPNDFATIHWPQLRQPQQQLNKTKINLSNKTIKTSFKKTPVARSAAFASASSILVFTLSSALFFKKNEYF